MKKQLAIASQTKGEIKIDMVRGLIRKRGSTVRDYRSACCMEVTMKRVNFKQVGLGFEPGLGLGPEVCDNERWRVKIEWFGWGSSSSSLEFVCVLMATKSLRRVEFAMAEVALKTAGWVMFICSFSWKEIVDGCRVCHFFRAFATNLNDEQSRARSCIYNEAMRVGICFSSDVGFYLMCLSHWYRVGIGTYYIV